MRISHKRVIPHGLHLLPLIAIVFLWGCQAAPQGQEPENVQSSRPETLQSSPKSPGVLSDSPMDIDPGKILRYGWIAEIEVKSVEHVSDAPGQPWGKIWVVFELRVMDWLRIPDEEVRPGTLVAIALDLGERDPFMAPGTADLAAGDRSIVVCNPYNEPEGVASTVLQGGMAAARESGLTDVRSCGFVRGWFSLLPDGTYSVPWASAGAGISEATLRELIGDSSPSIASLTIVLPTPLPAETASAVIAGIETSAAHLNSQTMARGANARETMQANHPAVMRARMAPGNGPIDKQTAVDKSMNIFPPGDSPTVAFAYHLTGAAAEEALDFNGGLAAITATWLVGLTRPGLTPADNEHVFGSTGPVATAPGSSVPPAVFFGYYFLWNEVTGELMNSGTLSQGLYGDSMTPLLGLRDDIEQ